MNVGDINPKGQIPLNFRVKNKDSGLIAALTKSHPLAVAYEVTVESLNRNDWVTLLDSENDVYTPGKLQVPRNSLVILDESNLEPGNINEIGIKNVQMLKEFVSKG